MPPVGSQTDLPTECPPVLTVAGSDNSAGAGIQADLKAISHFGCFGLTAVTCVVAEIPGLVEAVHPVPARILGAQIRLAADAFPLRAAKTGMLYSRTLIRATAESLAAIRVPLVVDPVMIATSGQPLLRPDAMNAYWKEIFPMATVLTPNLDELAHLTRRKISSESGLADAGKALADMVGCAVLAKGGHLKSRHAVDFLIHSGGIDRMESPRVAGMSTHGTGCTYSAAIAAGLALGHDLLSSARRAKHYISQAISQTLRWKGSPAQALQHFPRKSAH
ncbi:MAG: bifunctional hydroxymethylpyrimidine kinase/phosphomethylpyrimidine kinase [Terrimicrobiaceae bacterium]